MEQHNIPCPRAVVLKKHVLVMSFIGRDRVAAPKLKDAPLSASQLQSAYSQCVEVINTGLGTVTLKHGQPRSELESAVLCNSYNIHQT